MIRYIKRAIRDIRANIFLNVVTIVTIALAIMIVSAFVLFFINVNDIIILWSKGLRIMVYLEKDVSESRIKEIEGKINDLPGIENLRFISGDDAMETFRRQLGRQASLLDSIKENPLPDAFEIATASSYNNVKSLEKIASVIEKMPGVEEVEYGRKWIERFSNLIHLFKITGYAMGCLFFMAAVFFVANTIRLILYARREEIEIMRLVGGTKMFIKTPFYIQGVIQGALGGTIGLAALFALFSMISDKFNQELAFYPIRFLGMELLYQIMIGSMLVGWLGCFISLRQFLKD